MRRFLILGVLLALCTGLVLAQEQTSGTVEGVVTGEDGSPIDGAIVTVIGPQGARTATTDSEGRFSIRGLSSGSYSVKAEAPGFTPVVQTDVRVAINTRTQVPFALGEGMSEQVTVTSQAPLVDLKSTSTGATVDVDTFAPYVPLGRNLVSVFSIAPGVTDGGALGSTNPSISGSSGLENAYYVDGVNITNSGYGALGAYSIVYGSLGNGVTYDFLEEVQVKTGGFEAEYGQAGGGIVNSVVRSGSNTFKLNASWYEEPASLDGNRNDRLDTPNWGNLIETSRRDVAVSVGGPILKDRLFYYAAYNPIWTEATYKLTSGDADNPYYLEDTNGDGTIDTGDDPVFFNVGETVSGGRVPSEVTRDRSIDNYAGKISWFITDNHKVDVTAFGDPSDGDVGPQAPTSFLRVLADPINNPDASASATGLDWGGDQYSVKYQGVWSPDFFTEVQYAYKENSFQEFGPGTSFRSIFDPASGATIGGAGFFEDLADESDQWQLKNTHVFGPVELKYGIQYEDINWAQPRAYSGPAYTAYFPNLVEGQNIGGGMTGVAFAAGCTDPTDVTDPACYTAVQSSTGASISIEHDDANNDGVVDPGEFFGYNIDRTEFTPTGDPTTAEETSYFAQASWDIIPTVTLKVGARYTEQTLTGTGSTTLPIGTLTTGQVVGGMSTTLSAQEYDFDGEIAPRVGVTWDVMGDGRHKLYANWGEYYQRVPSDLAVRAFSNEVGVEGELFLDTDLSMPALEGNSCRYDGNGDGVYDETANCHEVTSVTGLAGGGSIILDGTQLDPMSDVYAALGSNVGLVNSKRTDLPYTEEMLFGYAWQVNDFSSVEVRYIQRELGRALEDVQFASNEQTWNLFWGESGGDPDSIGDPFPGHGAGAFGAYVFANVGGNVDSNLFPIPERNYDALEVIYNRRFNDGWMAYVNYRYAKLKGNYEGSFRNDNGQSDPFLTSLFDFPAASAVDTNGDGTFDDYLVSETLIGQYTNGPLNTDRRHILNIFASKTWDNGFNIGARMNVRTGQPLAPLFAHPTYRNAGEVPGFNPVYWSGVGVDVDADGTTDRIAFWTSGNATDPIPVGDTLADQADNIVNWDPAANGGMGAAIDLNGNEINGTITGFITGPRLYAYQVVQRDFFGRTTTEITFDLKASYDLALSGGKYTLTFLADVFNIFNDNDQNGIDTNFENRPGVPNQDFLKANSFQNARGVRLAAKFSW